MKRLGHKKTSTKVEGHQECGVCHPSIKNRKAKERRLAEEEIKMSFPPMSKVFESRFHGQVFTLDGIGYDVPTLTYWCQANLPVEEIPLADLQMSKSDEQHGSQEFVAHAQTLEQENVPPIVVVLKEDGQLQIADGNHRAWNAAASGKTTIPGYIVSQENLPKEAIVQQPEVPSP